jgi:hypothetical protein
MKQLKKLFVALVVVAGVTVSTPVMATDFSCTPTEVSVFENRIHVRCSEPALDGRNTIWFWAVSTVDAQHANRFLSTATTALVSGRKLILGFDPGDTSGVSFGCLAHDCRVPWKIGIY